MAVDGSGSAYNNPDRGDYRIPSMDNSSEVTGQLVLLTVALTTSNHWQVIRHIVPTLRCSLLLLVLVMQNAECRISGTSKDQCCIKSRTHSHAGRYLHARLLQGFTPLPKFFIWLYLTIYYYLFSIFRVFYCGRSGLLGRPWESDDLHVSRHITKKKLSGSLCCDVDSYSPGFT